MPNFFYSRHIPQDDQMILSVNVLKREKPIKESVYFAYNYSYLVLDYSNATIQHPKAGNINSPKVYLKSPRPYPFCLSMQGGSYIAISLKPTAFYAFTRQNAKENIDSFFELEKKMPHQNFEALYKQCEGIYDAKKVYQFIDSFYREECTHCNEPTPIDLVVEEILEKKGLITLDELVQKYPFSVSTLNRYFKNYLGMTAGLYCRLTKFSSLIQDLSNSDVQLKDIAYQYQYTDQSHFIREFKRFAGITPKQYMGPEYQLFIRGFE